MKKVLPFLTICLFCLSAKAQLFTKERLSNIENFDKQRWTYGFFFGVNNYDFDIDYKADGDDIVVTKSLGFNVGLVGDMRINDYFNIRLEPGLSIVNRDLTFPGDFPTEEDATREAASTYIHVPLLLKFSTKRLNNFKPFIEGGVSYSRNLSSNQDNPDDNSAGQFRMTNNTYYYEVGFGIDLYLFYFKFTPSIRGVFAISDELVRDEDPNSVYTSGIESMSSQGVFINFTFQ